MLRIAFAEIVYMNAAPLDPPAPVSSGHRRTVAAFSNINCPKV
jgi:hypothetical protein